MMTKMEGDSVAAEKLYRLRLVLPDLSQPLVGNWLASVEKSIPPELFHDFDDLFDAPETKSGRGGDAHASRRTRLEPQSRNQISARETVESSETIWQTTKSGKRHELWLLAAQLAPCGPEVHTWEVCHSLENWLLEKAYASFRETESLPLTHARSSTFVESKIEDGKPTAVLPLSSNSAPPSQSTIVPETELVRDALYALQGLPAAVRKLERLSRVYCASPADKSAQKSSTLWTRSVTASALGKVLSVIARAGHVRWQLDAFVSFFLENQVDPCEEKAGSAPKLSRKASNNKKRAAAQIKATEKRTKDESGPENADISSATMVSRQCLVNQAFAAAVKGILRGHSAALNTLASSVSLRRDQEVGVTFTDEASEERDPGPVLGCGVGDISLLEFYLHTRELRVQLHALAFICLKRNGRSFVGRTVSDAYLEEDLMDTKASELELGGNGGKSGTQKDGKCDPLVQSFELFPRGANLLTYLYDRLMEVDPLHMELLRFLFERAYEPYSIFVQSWLYQAAVKDPYGEFIIEQADFRVISSISKPQGKFVADPHPRDLKLRSGLYVPRFMENICTPLIRAGEQLQVLLKLPDTCELALQMANNARISDAFWPQSSLESLTEPTKNSPCLPALVFTKKKLQDVAEERERKSQELSDKFDVLFTELASRRSMERLRASSRSGTPISLSLLVNNSGIEDKEVFVRDPEAEENTCQELPSTILGEAQDGQERRIVKVAVTLPKRGWVTSKEDEQAADDSLSHSEGKNRRLWQVGSKNGAARLAVKEMEETAKPFTTSMTPDALGLTLDPRDPSELWFDTDPTRVSKGVKSSQGTSKAQTLISSYQRGTSWQMWGLPENPFVVQADLEDSASNVYVYPSFIGTYQHWDVTAKLASARAIIGHKSLLESSKGSRNFGIESNIEPSWFPKLEAALSDQLFAGLDAQLNSPSWGQTHFGSAGDEGEQWGLRAYEDQLPIQTDLKATDPLLFPPKDDSSQDALTSALLNSSPIVCSKSNDPAESISPQGSASPPRLMLELQSQRGTLTDLASPRSTHTEEILAERSFADSESVQGSDPLSPLHSALNVENDRLENCTTELSSSHDVTDGSGSVNEAGVKEVLSTCQLVEDSVLDSDENASRNAAGGTATMGSNVRDLDQGKADRSSAPKNSQSSRSAKVQGPANWVQHMSDALGPGAIQDAINDSVHEDDADEIPLSVVVSKCISDEILAQYQSVSTLTVRLFHEGLCLQDHYFALRRYYFMERGDWAEYFTTALCEHRWGPLGGHLRQMEVQGMLEAAFQKSSCEGDAYAERLYVTFQEIGYCCENSIHGSTKTSTSYVDPTRLDAFDFIALQYRVDWPLSLVLTNQSLSLYNVVFTFLLRMRLTMHALGDIWQRLQLIDRSLRKERVSMSSQQQKNRFRTLQQFRQQIYHFVVTLQRYVESKLLNVVWSKFLQDLELEVNDMQDLEIVHSAYLEEAAEECFLSAKTRGVKGCIDSIMQCVLDLSTHMRNSFWSREKVDLIDDNLFMQVHQVKKGFQASLQQLHMYQMKQEPQSRTNLNDLWMNLDYNGFLTAALSPTYF